MIIRVKFNHWYPRVFKVSAITLYPYMLFRDESADPTLLKHELCHVNQVRKLGYKFYLLYVYELLKNMSKGQKFWVAYFNISFEIEAREYEKSPLTRDEIMDLTLAGVTLPSEVEKSIASRNT